MYKYRYIFIDDSSTEYDEYLGLYQAFIDTIYIYTLHPLSMGIAMLEKLQMYILYGKNYYHNHQ